MARPAGCKELRYSIAHETAHHAVALQQSNVPLTRIHEEHHHTRRFVIDCLRPPYIPNSLVALETL